MQRYDAFFIPPEGDPDDAIVRGLRWLLDQPGAPLVLLHAKSMIDNNSTLGTAVRHYGIPFEAPRTVSSARWSGGAVLAPWASAKVIRCIDEQLAFRANAVCIIGWQSGDPNHAAWITARAAVDLSSGRSLGRPTEEVLSDPVVRIALDHAERFVNHNNALVQEEDKAYVIRTLEQLHRGGHSLNLDEIATYAMATGWTATEVERLREYGQKVIDGHRFRLRSSIGPKAGACEHWEAEAVSTD